MQIGKSHKTALGSRLLVLDEALSEFERWARGQTAEAVFYEERDNLTAAQRKVLLREIAEVRRLLREMQQTLGLKREQQNARQAIVSRCAHLWELLIELEPRYLRHYGPVPEELVEYMAPRAAELQRRIEAIGREIGGSGKRHDGGQPPDTPA